MCPFSSNDAGQSLSTVVGSLAESSTASFARRVKVELYNQLIGSRLLKRRADGAPRVCAVLSERMMSYKRPHGWE